MALGIASGLGALGAIEDILAGAAVTIGGVGLTGHEVPASMPFGGEQRLVEHDLVGGGTYIDVLGPKETPRTWSGTFVGPSAVSRARRLDAIRISGRKVLLTWGDFSCQVVVKSFLPNYARKGMVIPYSITCTVISTGTSAISQPTLLSSIAGDISSALDLPDLLPIAQTAVKVASLAVPIGAVLTHASPGFVALSGAVGGAASAVGAAQAVADTALANVGAAAGGQTFGGAAGLLAASAAQDASAAASQAAGFIGRAARNMGI